MSYKRKIVQFILSIINNAYFLFPFSKNIYQGKLKFFCSPGLNCYSCPASVFSCPIGALQNIFATIQVNFSLGKHILGIYIWGFLGTIGVLGGRIICGWACPFGLFQELLYKIPFKKFKIHLYCVTFLKYFILLVMVIILPMLIVDKFGYGETIFCKYFCPVGTLEAGTTLPLLIPSLKKLLGFLYFYKISILVIFIISFILVKRPFCRFFCPLGAIYSIFNKFSFFKLEKNEKKCIDCDLCTEVCPMELTLDKIPDTLNCIRCFNCVKACPVNAIKIIT